MITRVQIRKRYNIKIYWINFESGPLLVGKYGRKNNQKSTTLQPDFLGTYRNKKN